MTEKREIERLKAKIAALQSKPANAASATKKATKPKPKAKKSIMAAECESDRR